MKAGGEVQIRSSTSTYDAFIQLSKVESNKFAPEFRVEFRAEGKVIFLRPSTRLERLKAILMPSQARKKASATVDNVLKEMRRDHWQLKAGAQMRSVRSDEKGRTLAEQAILIPALTPASF